MGKEVEVLPTYVGVILNGDINDRKVESTTHIRGGDPTSYKLLYILVGYYPHTWG